MPKRRTTRPARHFGRRQPQFSGDLILVVCEGAKTEPQYFEGLREKWRLQSAQVEVHGEDCGSDPLSVVSHAVDLKDARRRAKRDGPPPYDQVWCVIDHDQHPKLPDAIQKAKAHKTELALSVPCFEFWYLLHFAYTTKPYQDFNEIRKELESYLPDRQYRKTESLVDILEPSLPTALQHAERLRKHIEKTASERPKTDVDLLVRKLQSLRPDRA